MILAVILDAFFLMVGAVAAWRIVKTVREGAAIYQGKGAFWSITALNVALVLGAAYGIATSFGF